MGLLEFQADAELLQEAQTNIIHLNQEIEHWERQELLSPAYEQNPVYLTSNPAAGV
ncbi:hypothetical protein H6F77_07350 [Microcoleus sp. FACHB-831]|uniref:hypothetical protein n=1 Tax=Microcoleus sp. FACHB-831 TaxID=2692827 RepID=UPI001689CDF6|nr:hypothetical protein [Microcoleus sp. FACHB-831]MBD1920901.1 hypothetical protein [Microcoleus sp. FACHB-831]